MDGVIILYIRDGIPSNILKVLVSVQGLYVAIKIREKIWLIGCSYNQL